jgi:hypothetical protein
LLTVRLPPVALVVAGLPAAVVPVVAGAVVPLAAALPAGRVAAAADPAAVVAAGAVVAAAADVAAGAVVPRGCAGGLRRIGRLTATAGGKHRRNARRSGHPQQIAPSHRRPGKSLAHVVRLVHRCTSLLHLLYDACIIR